MGDRLLLRESIAPEDLGESLKIVEEYQDIMEKYAKGKPLGFISFEAFLASKVLVNQISKLENKDSLTRKNLLKSIKKAPKNLLYEIEMDFKNNQLLNKTYLFEYKNSSFEEIKR